MNIDGAIEHRLVTNTSGESKEVLISLSGNAWSRAGDSKTRLFFPGIFP